MKILHIQGFTKEERMDKLREIRENIFDSIKELTSNMEYLRPSIALGNEENQESLDFVKKLDMATIESYEFPDEFYEHCGKLWSDPGIQACYLRSNEFFLIDSAKYFLDKIEEIRDVNFQPSDQDILHSRKRTSEIQKIEFEVKVPKQYGGKYQPFWMFDVGGQRGERRKWIQVFDGITAILFVVDSSGFDTKLREDGAKNRLQESLELFEDIWFSKYLINTGIILFLNKQDILKEKIQRGSRIENYFPDFKDYKLTSGKDGDPTDEYNRARCFIRDKFIEVTKKSRNTISQYLPNDNYKIKRECFYHFTTATDTKNIKRVFDDVHTMILIKNLDIIV
ncbi:Guanine nucleotide-binding protein G(f) subunit alpha [Sarcoptes scabiei]|uniref:Guanine nucleotide-binding protein G(s) subunit alpha n=1 Tax=Sarcoptes scabiei TaxID=52283 RepID=A0A834R9S8_SARSC|nr:Guanine nucleotide-binding protein G(f) subunit alpha [Sarcoptes scabiei]